MPGSGNVYATYSHTGAARAETVTESVEVMHTRRGKMLDYRIALMRPLEEAG